MSAKPLAVIAGAGGALGPALVSALDRAGYQVAAIARSPGESGAATWFRADLADAGEAGKAYDRILAGDTAPAVLIYNAHRFVIESFEETSAECFETVWRTDTLGAFLAAKRVLPVMLNGGGGTVIFSGATASIRGSARFAAFASAKFALRGLAQCLAREYGGRGLHVAHVVIDGLIDGGHAQTRFGVAPEDCIAAEAVAATYLNLIAQPASAWTHELDVRPCNGKF